MAKKARCEVCDRTFKNAESLAMHNSAKHSENIKINTKSLNLGKYKGWAVFLIITVSIILSIMWLSSLRTILPPKDMAGHIESSPKSHILKKPMDIRVQKHMLEHVDGKEEARGGAIINYNCKDYDCGQDLIKNLEAFTDKYSHVYVAPFKNMDAKIALTKLNRIEILEEFDRERIDKFVR